MQTLGMFDNKSTGCHYWRKSTVWPDDTDIVTYDPFSRDSGHGLMYSIPGPSSSQWMVPGTHG